jgi:ABC-type Na+ efflux pump permease subunit
MSSKTASLRDYLLLEWRHASRRVALAVAFGGVLTVIFTHIVMPLFPDRAISFMKQGFRLSDMAAVLLLNDLMGVYFPTYFLGLASSLSIVLAAREEHRLEILLAKPIRPSQFVLARALPVLASSLFVGVIISAACAVAIAIHSGLGASVGAAGAFGGGLALTALALVLIAALQIAFVRIRDPFQGLLVAAFLFLMTSMPAAVLLYRPDAYENRELLLNTICMTTLVWHDKTLAWLGPILLIAAIPISVLLVRAAGAVLERSDSA